MKITNSDWYAWYNVMPGGNPHTLHVTGTIDVGNNSDSATLVVDSFEKRNPPNLVLRIEPRTIFIPRPQGDNKVRLHYQEPGSPGKYGTIKIVQGGALVKEITNIEIAT